MPEARERWNSRTAFVMAAVGSAVGLGNVWRFPTVCYQHGGGAFFIPYFIALLTAGIPLMILEYGVGQMMQGSAPRSLGRVNRHFEWLGWFALGVATIISIYYAIIMAYALEYLVYAFKGFFSSGVMPWSGSAAGSARISEAAFFTNVVRNHSADTDQIWQPVWHLVGALALTWLAIFLIVYRGVKRVGKVVMLTVPLPVVVLLILILRGITLPGAGSGIVYYLTPNFEALTDPQTWIAAYGQIFFSLTIGFGVMIAYASYMPQDSDITNNAFITCFSNCATSFFAGFAVFSVLGFLAWRQGGVPVSEVLSGGPGLVFVTYPTAISEMGSLGWFWPPVVGVLFFVMLLFLGVDSLFSLTEGLTAGLKDRYPRLSTRAIAGGICLGCFLIGSAIFANRAGILWLDIFDHWTNDYGLVIVGLLECLAVGYFFKTRRLRDFINENSEIKLWGWWELCIRLITPLLLGYLLFTSLLRELTRESIYGTGGTGFDRYIWIAPLIFLGLFLAAFALSRLWKALYVFGAALVVFAFFRLALPEGTGYATAIFATGTTVFLFGTLGQCISLARRKGKERKTDG